MSTLSWHTAIHKSHLYGDFIHIEDADGRRVGCTDAKNPEHRANAEIMAAAPKLLAALKLALAEMEALHAHNHRNCEGGCPYWEAHRAACAAIACVSPGEPTEAYARALVEADEIDPEALRAAAEHYDKVTSDKLLSGLLADMEGGA